MTAPTIEGNAIQKTKVESSPLSDLWRELFILIYVVVAGSGVIGCIFIKAGIDDYYNTLDRYRHFSGVTYPQYPDPFTNNEVFWLYVTAPPALLFGVVFFIKFLRLLMRDEKAVSAPVYPPLPRTSTLYGDAKFDDYADAVRALRDDDGSLRGPEPQFED